MEPEKQVSSSSLSPVDPLTESSFRYSNYSSIRTFDESGATDYTDLFNVFQNRYTKFENDAGYIPMQNLQDRSARTGFSLADWTPRKDPKKQAVEWFEMDFEYGATPVSQ